MCGVYLLMFLLIGRNVYLQVFKHDFFEKKSNRQLTRNITLAPTRGYIFDRNHTPLTINKPAFSAFAETPSIEDKAAFARLVTKHVGGSASELERKLNSKATFLWVARKIEADVKEALEKENLRGLGFVKEHQRYYPKGELAAPILGFVGVDNQGLSGLEFENDVFLSGSPGKIVLEGDPRGNRLLSGKKITYPLYDGGHIITTLDEVIQYSAEKHLAEGVAENEARKGCVIVMDPKTGEILAMANVPNFDPNNRETTWDRSKKNRCITDVYEPGSTFKIFTIAAAVEEGLANEDTVINVPRTLTLAKHTISEAHDRAAGEDSMFTVSEILEQSLNVGASILAQQMGEKKVYDYVRKFGFGERTGIEFPGEVKGLVRSPKNWSALDIAMFSFGQGLAVTPLQLITGLTVFANDGYLVKPQLISYKSQQNGKTVKGNPTHYKKRVLSTKTVDSMKIMMTRVVEKGTGRPVQIPGYSIMGKTGTAQRARDAGRGYEPGAYVSSFFGAFPADDPNYFILVVIDTPTKKGYYGSTVAGPVFKAIAEDIIRYKQIPPKFSELEKPTPSTSTPVTLD